MMNATALICDDQQQFSLQEFPLPQLKPSEILIKTHYSGVSVGTEFAVIRHTLDWGPYPLCTGYQAVGEVVKAGQEVDDYQVGQLVYYRRNYLKMTLGEQVVNTAAGTHCSHALIDPSRAEGIAHLPEEVDEVTGSAFVMPSVGFNAVDMAGVRMGEVVLVYGSGLIGLGALVAARLRGAITIAVDINPLKLALAHDLGIDYTIDGRSDDVRARVEEISPAGADVVFEATGISANLDSAFALARTHGKFVFLGNYGEKPISFYYLVPHPKQLTAFFPCNDGLAPCRAAVMRNIAAGAIPWRKTISHVVRAESAPELFDQINRGRADEVLGAVIQWL